MADRRARVSDVHEIASSMPHVKRIEGPKGNAVYQVGGKSFVFFRTPQPDARDPVTDVPYPDVIMFWVESESEKLALVQDPTSPFFTTDRFDGHLSVLIRAAELGAIDRAVVNWTRLESRFRTSFIYVKDSMRMYGSYVQVLEYLKAFAGDANRVDMAAGVRPTEEPLGPTDSPNLRTESATGATANTR